MEKRTSASNWTIDSRSCYKDDVEVFDKDGTWTVLHGTEQCSTGAGVTRGSWKLAVNNTKLIFSYQGATGEYESTVESLSENELILSHSSGDLQNTQVKTTYKR